VVLGGWGLSYERGTPVGFRVSGSGSQDLKFSVSVFGFRAHGSGFRVDNWGQSPCGSATAMYTSTFIRVSGLCIRISASGCRIQDLTVSVQDSGLRFVSGLGRDRERAPFSSIEQVGEIFQVQGCEEREYFKIRDLEP